MMTETYTLTNKTLFCNNPQLINSSGFLSGKNPLQATVPLLLLQLILISLASKAVEICLRPLRQSIIVSQILGGLVLGPSVLGQAPEIAAMIFPQRGTVMIETLATFGIVLFVFSLGVKMDARLMFNPDKLAFSISMSLFIFTLIIPLILTITIINQVQIEEEFQRSLPLLVGSQSLVSFPAIACLLAELKIFNTEVGRLAVAVSMFYDLLALSTTALLFAYFETQQEGFLKTVAVIMSIIGSILGIVFVSRILMWRILVPEEKVVTTVPETAENVKSGLHFAGNFLSVGDLVNILEASNASEQNPIAVIVIVLVEVVGKSAAMLLAYRPQRSLEPSNSSNNHITNAFQQYERQNEGKASVQVYTNMSHFDAMHDDIRRVAADKRANFIILPFHKQWAIDGTVGAVNQSIREMNLKLLECVPCSLGILIDRGPSNNSSSSLNSKSVYQVVVLFVGGVDDTEALAYGTRMVKHQRVVVTVTRFLLLGQDNKGRKHESETIEEFRKSNSLLLGLHEWSECPELGVIGDLLSSPDGETTASEMENNSQLMSLTPML